METELQGTKGYEKMYVDSVGRVLEVTEQQDRSRAMMST